MEVYKILTEAR